MRTNEFTEQKQIQRQAQIYIGLPQAKKEYFELYKQHMEGPAQMPNKSHEVHKVCKIGVFFRKTQRQKHDWHKGNLWPH